MIPLSADLIEAAKGGETEHVERLVIAIWPDAYRLARAIVGERPGAEDVAQEACIILYRTIGSLRSTEAFRVWFYRIVAREAAALKRRCSRLEPILDAAPENGDEDASIDVWRALSRLPQHLRDVVVLRYFEDLSSREIASILRIPDGTVRFRLMIARRRLRPLLGENPEHATHPNEATNHAV